MTRLAIEHMIDLSISIPLANKVTRLLTPRVNIKATKGNETTKKILAVTVTNVDEAHHPQ
jgi:hypothetical protein